jgi:sec-independent protein translocase protein TatC
VALVALLTPSGDPFTLVILSVPMLLFYELAILVGRVHERRRSRRGD